MHVEDHLCALEIVLQRGMARRSYAIGGREEHCNIAAVTMICGPRDARPPLPGAPRRERIRLTADRPGHDRRYAIDPARIEAELGGRAVWTFAGGLSATFDWQLARAR